jgi:hypothetical protein
LFFDNFLAQFTFGVEGAAVNDAKSLFLFMVGQGDNSFDNYVLLNLSIRLRVWVADRRVRANHRAAGV